MYCRVVDVALLLLCIVIRVELSLCVVELVFCIVVIVALLRYRCCLLSCYLCHCCQCRFDVSVVGGCGRVVFCVWLCACL